MNSILNNPGPKSGLPTPKWLCISGFVRDINKLAASLKDDTTRMNDSNKHKVTGQINYQIADPKANASVFIFFSNAHFLKTILTSRTSGTFGFAPTHKADASAKPKEPLFSQRLDNKSYFALMNFNQ